MELVSQLISLLVCLASIVKDWGGGSRDYWCCGPEGSSLISEGEGGVSGICI